MSEVERVARLMRDAYCRELRSQGVPSYDYDRIHSSVRECYLAMARAVIADRDRAAAPAESDAPTVLTVLGGLQL